MARLYATARLLELALCPTPSSSSPTSPSSSSSSPEAGAGSEHEQGMPRLQAVCKENKTEENLKNLADDLDVKDFALSPGEPHAHTQLSTPYRPCDVVPTEMSQQLQAHCNWLLEMAIVIVSAIAEGETHVVRAHHLTPQTPLTSFSLSDRMLCWVACQGAGTQMRPLTVPLTR